MDKVKHNDIKFIFKNIGAIEYAEVPLNDLTMIVGKNSTSKTYLTYIIWGFLDLIHGAVFNPRELTNKTMFNSDGTLKQELDINLVIANIPQIISDYVNIYKKSQVSKVLAIDNFERLKNFDFTIELSNTKLDHNIKIDDFDINQIKISSLIKKGKLSFSILKSSDYVLTENDKTLIANHVFGIILHKLLIQIFPKPFIITSERTGVGVFRKEIDGFRSGFAESLARDSTTKNISTLNKNELDDLVNRAANLIARYPLPISKNISLSRDLFDVTTKTNFAITSKEYIKENLTHGEFVFNKELNEVLYNQKINNTTVSLPYYLVSSSIKSHLLLDSYINYIAESGQILIIDEPELNLHPDNLRYMARLLAMLVNSGVKLLFTTHNDYIIKELNNLIMLENLPEDAQNYAIKQINKETKTEYQTEMFLAKDKVTCIIAKHDEKSHTVKTEIAPMNEFGINAKIIDDEINSLSTVSNILYNVIDAI